VEGDGKSERGLPVKWDRESTGELVEEEGVESPAERRGTVEEGVGHGVGVLSMNTKSIFIMHRASRLLPYPLEGR